MKNARVKHLADQRRADRRRAGGVCGRGARFAAWTGILVFQTSCESANQEQRAAPKSNPAQQKPAEGPAEQQPKAQPPTRAESPSPMERKPDPAPGVATPPPSSPAQAPTPNQPAQPTTQPAATQPTTKPVDKLPEYLTVTRRFEAGKPVRVEGKIEAERRVILDTDNAQRIRFDRRRIPVRRDRSIILVIDGQGIEWLASSTVTEFERTKTGAWVALEPGGR